MDLSVLRLNGRWLGRFCFDLLTRTPIRVWPNRLYSVQLVAWTLQTPDAGQELDARTRDRIEAVLSKIEVLGSPARAERLLFPLAGNRAEAEGLLRVQLQPHRHDPVGAGLLLVQNMIGRIGPAAGRSARGWKPAVRERVVLRSLKS